MSTYCFDKFTTIMAHMDEDTIDYSLIFPAEYADFKQHIEDQWVGNMSWDNHGTVWGILYIGGDYKKSTSTSTPPFKTVGAFYRGVKRNHSSNHILIPHPRCFPIQKD
jgi:hypothetical protein